jgi:uncharacterized phage-associated protein
MQGRYRIDHEKIIHTLLFILDQLGGKSDLHKLFKILYFADQKHLVKYGFPITGDFYIAMEYGPVPSKTYDVLKALRGDSFWNVDPIYATFISVTGKIATAKSKPDLDELAESDIKCLVETINENKNLSFQDLVHKSHKLAWNNAQNDFDNFENEMKVEDIAREANVNEEVLKYILLNLENQLLVKDHAES